MTVVGLADFTTSITGVWVAVTVADDVADTAGPVGGLPVTDAVLLTTPAFMSANVTSLVAVHVVDAFGASVLTGHVTAVKPGSGSLTVMPVRVTLPTLVTAKL